MSCLLSSRTVLQSCNRGVFICNQPLTSHRTIAVSGKFASNSFSVHQFKLWMKQRISDGKFQTSVKLKTTGVCDGTLASSATRAASTSSSSLSSSAARSSSSATASSVVGRLKNAWLSASRASKTASVFTRPTSSAANAAKSATSAASGIKLGVPDHAKTMVGRWLVGCAGMAMGTVLLGGSARLTKSGLAMVEWDPLKDLILPTDEQEWQAKFELYKKFPEYKYRSKEEELTLADFKSMYRLEWAHRLWTRVMGLAFFVPGLYLLGKGYIPRGLKPRLVMHSGALVLQSWLGYKVLQSGLQEPEGEYDVPRQSPYWVSGFMLSTLSVYAMFLWQGLAHLHVPQPLARTYIHRRTFMIWSHAIMALTVFTAVTGSVVSSTDAGLVYNSWPMMADRWIPTDLWALGDSKWKNAFENTTTSQFLHRSLAHTTVALACGFWLITRRAPLPPRARVASHFVLAAAVLQLGLGVATLLTLVQPHTAMTHQCGSMLLLTTAIWLANELRRVPK